MPVSFLEQGDGPTPMTMGMELFTRYHPAATRQRMYERLLASEVWRAEQEEKQRDFLVEQLRFAQEDLSQLRKESERLRAVEGGAVRGTSSGRGTATAGLDELLKQSANVAIARAEHSIELHNKIRDEYRPAADHQIFNSKAIRALEDPDFTKRQGAPGIAKSIVTEYGKHLDRLQAGGDVTENQRRAGAADLVTSLMKRHPEAFTVQQGYGDQIIEAVNTVYGLYGANEIPSGGASPRRDINEEIARRTEQARVAIGMDPEARELVLAGARREARMSPEERRAEAAAEATARRQREGIAEPLDPTEQGFLDRYIDALRDDGVATIDEFDGDKYLFEYSRDIYNTARSLDQLPRGYELYFDDQYLDALRRKSQTTQQLEALPRARDPRAVAARRTLQQTEDPRGTRYHEAAHQAASAVHPIAAEAMRPAMELVRAAGGGALPVEGEGHRFAAAYVDKDTERNFGAFIREASRSGLKSQDLLDAAAFYGAHHYREDARTRTTRPGPMQGRPAAPTPAPSPEGRQTASRPVTLTEGAREYLEWSHGLGRSYPESYPEAAPLGPSPGQYLDAVRRLSEPVPPVMLHPGRWGASPPPIEEPAVPTTVLALPPMLDPRGVAAYPRWSDE